MKMAVCCEGWRNSTCELQGLGPSVASAGAYFGRGNSLVLPSGLSGLQ